VAVLLSQIPDSRVWLHSSGVLHVWFHLGLFVVLSLLATRISDRTSVRLTWLAALLLLGLGMEFAEAYNFSGIMEWADVRSDAIGVALGGLAGWLLSWSMRRHHKRP